MSPLAQAHILAAQLLAHNLEKADLRDIKAGLKLVRLRDAINEHQELFVHREYDHLIERWRVTQGQYIAMVWGGRDCDGVQSEGEVHYVRASLTDVLNDIDKQHADAEGPCWWHMVSPSKAQSVERTSRDLTMEAFEDGHSHVLYA